MPRLLQQEQVHSAFAAEERLVPLIFVSILGRTKTASFLHLHRLLASPGREEARQGEGEGDARRALPFSLKKSRGVDVVFVLCGRFASWRRNRRKCRLAPADAAFPWFPSIRMMVQERQSVRSLHE
ncbi:hypothetical protein TGP89_366070 [Toxoplasma gondii p89]|uniref:Uncharacterized protein n=1 Tax=Toxoplasma gondii p89 TaxID=943119 RepID=A0A086JXP7_TOXGO|nr:hypothetical protein TGP89_366070 [Toxoplasma gondii p89]